jgi:chromosome segregation ATPase
MAVKVGGMQSLNGPAPDVDLGRRITAIEASQIELRTELYTTSEGLAELKADVKTILKKLERIDALATVLVGEQHFTDEELARSRLATTALERRIDELAGEDKGIKRGLESVRAKAVEAKRSADDSTQRFALDSAHAIERLSEHELAASRRLEDKAERERAKLEDEADDKRGAIKTKRAEMSRAQWTIVLAVVTIVAGGAERLVEYAVTHEAPHAPQGAKP